MHTENAKSIETDQIAGYCTNISGKEDYCVSIIGSYQRPTSPYYNEPHERAKGRLAGEVSPMSMERESFITAGMNHAAYICSLTEVELREPLDEVEKQIDDLDRAYQLNLVNVESEGIADGGDFGNLVDDDELLWFETNVFEDVKVMQSYFLSADLVILRKKLADRWDEFHRRNV